MAKTYFYDGLKSVNVESLSPEAWTYYSNAPQQNGEVLYRNTAFLYAVIQKIAQAVSSLPLTINGEPLDESSPLSQKIKAKKASTAQNKLNNVNINLRDLMFRWSLCNSLYAKGYAVVERNQYKYIKRVKFINPRTVNWEIDYTTGEIKWFRRNAQSELGLDYYYYYDPVSEKVSQVSQGYNGQRFSGSLAWFWASGIEEIGESTPAIQIAKNPAAVLASIDQLAVNLFTRGAIDPFFVTLPGPQKPTKDETNEIRARIRRTLFRGLESAFGVEIFEEGVKVETVSTQSPKNLALTELDNANQNDICAVFNTPRPIVIGEMNNRSVADRLTQNWFNTKVIPDAKMILHALNFHIFDEMEINIGIHDESILVNQEDEVARVSAVSGLVSAGETLENAYAIFGYDLPETVKKYYEDKKAKELASANPPIDEKISTVQTSELPIGQLPPIDNSQSDSTNIPSIQKPTPIDTKPIDTTLKIIEAFHSGQLERDNAIYMVSSFMGIDEGIADKLIPKKRKEDPAQTPPPKATKNFIDGNVKHPGHSPQSVHGRRKTTNSEYREQCSHIIEKPLSDYVDHTQNNVLDLSKLSPSEMSQYLLDNDISLVSQSKKPIWEVKREEYKDWESSLSETEKDIIRDYTGAEYYLLNKNLRNNSVTEHQKRAINILDGVINRSELNEDVILRRGIMTQNSPFSKAKIGDVVTDPAYGSTSFDRGFTGEGYETRTSVVLNIRASKGTKGAFVGFESLSNIPSESEFILPRNTNYYVNGIIKEKNPYGEDRLIMDVTIIPSPLEYNKKSLKHANHRQLDHGRKGGRKIDNSSSGSAPSYSWQSFHSKPSPQTLKFIKDNEYKGSSASNIEENKRTIADTISEISGLKRQKVLEIMHEWTKSSNDNNPTSLLLQQVASEEFGIPLSDWQKKKMSNIDTSNSSITPDEMKSFIHAVYENTQTELSNAGYSPDDMITLYRGYTEIGNHIYEEGEVVEYQGNAVESWTAHYEVAQSFANKHTPNTVELSIAMSVPVRNILGAGSTGLGSWWEKEVVIAGSFGGTAVVGYSAKGDVPF